MGSDELCDAIEGAGWEGVMVTYTEQDFPGSQPYERQVPGWRHRCGYTIGTADLPPRRCPKCGEPRRKLEREAPPPGATCAGCGIRDGLRLNIELDDWLCDACASRFNLHNPLSLSILNTRNPERGSSQG